MKLHAFVIAAAVLILGLAMRQPAAADTGTLSLMESTNYTGPCPVTLHFNGTISGLPSSAVKYHFAHYVAGVWTNTSDVSTTIPPNGALSVSNQLVIDAAHAGFQSNELQLVTPSAGNDLSKAKIYFTVTCGSPATPTPPPNGVIAPPFALDSTKSPSVCGDYFGAPLFAGLACAAAIADDELVFIWKWDPNNCGTGNACITNIDGYRIYQKGHPPVLKQVDNPQQFATGSSVKASKSKGMCFYAVAFKGNQNSVASNTFCSQGGPSLASAILHPSNMLNTDFYKHGEYDSPFCFYTGGVGAMYAEDAWKTQQIVVGFTEFHNSSGICYEYETSTYRGAWKFDLSSLAGKFVQKATLSFHLDASHPPTLVSCADGIYFPNTDWTVGAHTVHVPVGDLFDSVSPDAKRFVTFDVTNRVRAWMKGDIANNGFAMKGSMEDLNQQGNTECTSIYGSFRLTVNYFNS